MVVLVYTARWVCSSGVENQCFLSPILHRCTAGGCRRVLLLFVATLPSRVPRLAWSIPDPGDLGSGTTGDHGTASGIGGSEWRSDQSQDSTGVGGYPAQGW